MIGTIIEVQLLAGRFHAHVWGESQFAMASAEWPPSPWRLLRALAAAWFSARPEPSSPEERDELLQALGRSGPPELWLPRVAFRETRYYQPVRLGGPDRVLHHDQFAIPEGGRFWFVFGAELGPEQRSLLADLLRRIRYFGRAESRAIVRLVDVSEPPASVLRALPHDHPDRAETAVNREALCPTPDFLASDLWSLRDAAGSRARSRSRTPASNGAHPRHLVDELLLRKMPIPDGAQRVTYALPSESLVSEIRHAPPRATPDLDELVPVSVIRFALDRRTPIPLMSLVAVARAFRNQAVRNHAELRPGVHSVALTGLELDGYPVKGHRHVYYVPRLAPGQLRVDRLEVLVPAHSLMRGELEAILAVERIRIRPRDPYPITVVPEDLEVQSKASEARRWRSATPFLPPLRHRAGRTATLKEEQLGRLLKERCGEPPVEIRSAHGPGGAGAVTEILSHDYGAAHRDKARQSPALTRRAGFWFEVRFDRAVELRHPLGTDAHFGLGQFAPC